MGELDTVCRRAPIRQRPCQSRACAARPHSGPNWDAWKRWGFITLVQDSAHRRDGWGSGRGIRADWLVRLTSKGLTASKIWPPLSLAIQQKWETRFGAPEIKSLRNSLHDIVIQWDIKLPQALPAGLEKNEEKYPPRVTPTPTDLPLPALLSQVLLAFRIDFERESPTSLPLCTNTLRILGDEPIPAREIPVRTGASPETSGIVKTKLHYDHARSHKKSVVRWWHLPPRRCARPDRPTEVLRFNRGNRTALERKIRRGKDQSSHRHPPNAIRPPQSCPGPDSPKRYRPRSTEPRARSPRRRPCSRRAMRPQFPTLPASRPPRNIAALSALGTRIADLALDRDFFNKAVRNFHSQRLP